MLYWNWYIISNICCIPQYGVINVTSGGKKKTYWLWGQLVASVCPLYLRLQHLVTHLKHLTWLQGHSFGGCWNWKKNNMESNIHLLPTNWSMVAVLINKMTDRLVTGVTASQKKSTWFSFNFQSLLISLSEVTW